MMCVCDGWLIYLNESYDEGSLGVAISLPGKRYPAVEP